MPRFAVPSSGIGGKGFEELVYVLATDVEDTLELLRSRKINGVGEITPLLSSKLGANCTSDCFAAIDAFSGSGGKRAVVF